MESWVLLQFAFALAIVISGIALILSELHMIERAERQKLWSQLREKIEAIR